MKKSCRFSSTGFALAYGLFCAVGCTANVEKPLTNGNRADPRDPSQVSSGSGGSPSPSGMPSAGPLNPATGSGGGAQVACAPGAPMAPARVWMLTDEQYVNVVKDGFEVTLQGAETEITTAKSTSGNFTNQSEAFQVGTPAAQAYQRTAAKVAALVKPCGANVTVTCVEQFIREKVARAWRRPTTEAEVGALLKIFNDYVAVDGPDSALGLVVQAVLQSPSFIYRSEIGIDASTSTTPVSLTAHELASALGFLTLNSAPDESLWAKANDGTLSDPTVLSAEVDRLLASPDAQSQLSKLVGYWGGVELIPGRNKSNELFPEYSDALKASLFQSAQAFLSDTVWAGKFADLFTSRKIYLNEELGKVYGFPGITGTALVPTDVPATFLAAGLLTQPGILPPTNKRSSQADPIHRGLFLYDALVCGGTLPAAPPGALDVAKTMMGSERELANQRALNPTCQGCHSAFDPLGLTLEQFDPIGRYKPTDSAGAPIASDAVLAGLGPSLDGPVSGIVELAARLSSGRRAADCATRAVSTYSLGYASGTESCDLTQAKDQFAVSGSFPEFFKAFLTAPGFRLRSPELK